jgi:hypothetical protein
MRATLHITAGPHAGKKIALRDGQVAQFGRTEWADYSFPADAAMSDVHFRVECAGRQCLVRDMQSAAGTMVDGRPVNQHVLATGMAITAGGTQMVVVLGDDAWPPPGMSAPGAPAAPPPVPEIRLLAARAKLSEEALALVKDEHTPPQLVAALRKQSRQDDAVALIAAWLPKATAVAWICRCLRGSIERFGAPPLDRNNESALATAERWAAEPSDEVSFEASAAAEKLAHETAAAWAAMAAYYNGSSLTPPPNEPVPPPEDLGSSAANTAIVLGLCAIKPAQRAAAREQFCDWGLEAAAHAK